MMATTTAPLAAIHLAVLVDLAPDASPAGHVWGVLVYDGCGYRHLHRLDPPLPADRLTLDDHDAGQLRLPIGEPPATPTSAGLTWRTYVLTSIPLELRGLAPRDLAAALAAQLTDQLSDQASDEAGSGGRP